MSSHPKQRKLIEAKEARDEALQRVKTNSGTWYEDAIKAAKTIPHGWIGTAEDLRLHLIRSGLEKPHHHNVWGAFINTCIRKRILIATGDYEHMQTRRSHARRTPVYQRR